jgi:hypothetical protein
MIQKFKLFSLAGLLLTFCTLMVACGDTEAEQEPVQEMEVPMEEPAEIVLDTTNVVTDTTAEQRPVIRR